jgi:hypothetical protein
VVSWFETREAALLTMRESDKKNSDLILRSIAKRCVSKDEVENALGFRSARR